MNAINDVKVEISVVLGRAVMPIRQLLKMGRGAVVDMDTGNDSPVLIYANNEVIAKGEIVISGDRIAISITEGVRSYQA